MPLPLLTQPMQALYEVQNKINWPDYARPMHQMRHVPRADVKKLAAWINAQK
jgi:hypothetical protein